MTPHTSFYNITRNGCKVLLAAGMFVGNGGALAQAAATSSGHAFPAKPIRVLVPFPAGSGVDILARMIGNPLAEAWGQAVVVDNRPGASGAIACELAAKAVPDGYTLLLGNASSLAMAPSLYAHVGYDPVRSFAPITQISSSANVLVVHPSVPATSISALIALAKTKPGQLTYGSGGSGSSPHLSGELFKSMTGVNLVHVPYKGTPQLITDLLGGQIHMSFTSLVSALPYIKQGRLRPLGVTSLTRAASLPELPTISESGLKGYEVTVWQGMLAPAGTPRTVVGQLNAQIAKILRAPATRERLAAQGLEAAASTPDEFSAYIATEVVKWGKVIKQAGMTAD
jgi:tripartite-type tricarboxylate transporter receptor subunit TctC